MITALADPDTLWSFCPNFGADVFFIVLFALTTITHLVQAILYRKGYCWVIICSGLAQTKCYIFRAISIQHPASFSDYAAWFILILVSSILLAQNLIADLPKIAPLLTNAFAYMVMGRMVYNFTKQAKIFGVQAWRFTLYFVLLDSM